MSTHNIHIHLMGNLVTGDIHYLYTKVRDPYNADHLRDTCVWGSGMFNCRDGALGFGKTGWATEQFFPSDAVQDDETRLCDGGIWKDYLPWVAGYVLLGCAENIPDSFFSE